MKFLLVASFAPSLTLFRGPLIRALQDKGCEVHVAAPDLDEDDALRRRLESQGLVVHDFPLGRTGMNPLTDLRTLWRLWRLMREVKPDFVLSYTIKPVIYGTLAAWLADVPRRYALITGLGYAFTTDDKAGGSRSLLRKMAQALYRSALRRTHTVFFQNPDDEALFRQWRIVAPSAHTVVVDGSGVDLRQFKPVPTPPTTHFLLIARLLGNKGIREYVEAARHIRRQYPDTRFSLVGWRDDNPDAITAEELADWQAGGHLDFLGRLEDVRPAIAACSVYVLPSYREGTPRTVLEAMAMGRAIITTDAPGCRETVKDGQNGYLVPVKSVESLVDAMQRFLADPTLADRMGACSRRIAEARYDVDKVNAVMLQEMGV